MGQVKISFSLYSLFLPFLPSQIRLVFFHFDSLFFLALCQMGIFSISFFPVYIRECARIFFSMRVSGRVSESEGR